LVCFLPVGIRSCLSPIKGEIVLTITLAQPSYDSFKSILAPFKKKDYKTRKRTPSRRKQGGSQVDKGCLLKKKGRYQAEFFKQET
jgi:hypothetical protein